MFLTRIGFGSKAVITGDTTQVDVPGGRSGLAKVEPILRRHRRPGVRAPDRPDVVRHRIVQDIVDAYERSAAEAEREVAARVVQGRRDAGGPAVVRLDRGLTVSPTSSRDEPPSPSPRAATAVDAPASHAPMVTAADERTEDSTPVALADLAALLVARAGRRGRTDVGRGLAAAGRSRRDRAAEGRAPRRRRRPTDVLSFPVDGVERRCRADRRRRGLPVGRRGAGVRRTPAASRTSCACWWCTAGCTWSAGTMHPSRTGVAMWDRERDLVATLYGATGPRPLG